MHSKQKLNLKISSNKTLILSIGLVAGLIAILSLTFYLLSVSTYGSSHLPPGGFPSQSECPELYEENPNPMVLLHECHEALGISGAFGPGLIGSNIIPFGSDWFCAGSGTVNDIDPGNPRPWFDYQNWDDVSVGTVDTRAWSLLLCAGLDTDNLENSMLCQNGPPNSDDPYDPVAEGDLTGTYYYPWNWHRDPEGVGAEVAGVCGV